jgi:serine/threonine protein kinase
MCACSNFSYILQDEKLFRAKISDFGLSAHMTAGQTHVNISQGTEAYLPKEVFQNLAVTEASDIYAMGLLMWEIFYGIFWFIVWDTEKRRKKCAAPLPHMYTVCVAVLNTVKVYHMLLRKSIDTVLT